MSGTFHTSRRSNLLRSSAVGWCLTSAIRLFSTQLALYLSQQAEIDDFLDRDFADILFAFTNDVEVHFKLLFADNAVFIESFDDRAVGLVRDLRIDFPLPLYYTGGSFGIFLSISKSSIERSDDSFDFLWMLLDALLGSGVAITGKLDHVPDE
jgi:hypothetical protein